MAPWLRLPPRRRHPAAARRRSRPRGDRPHARRESGTHPRCPMSAATTATVGEATPADAEAIGEIHARSWAATYPQIPPPSADRGARGLVRAASRAGRRASHARCSGRRRRRGFVHLGPSPDADHDPQSTGHIFSIHVDPDVVGTGVGRASDGRRVRRLPRRRLRARHAVGRRRQPAGSTLLHEARLAARWREPPGAARAGR